MRTTVFAALIAASAAANLCFTAHEKTKLSCRAEPCISILRTTCCPLLVCRKRAVATSIPTTASPVGERGTRHDPQSCLYIVVQGLSASLGVIVSLLHGRG